MKLVDEHAFVLGAGTQENVYVCVCTLHVRVCVCVCVHCMCMCACVCVCVSTDRCGSVHESVLKLYVQTCIIPQYTLQLHWYNTIKIANLTTCLTDFSYLSLASVAIGPV